MNMARKETLATPCIFLRERLWRTKTMTSQDTFCLFAFNGGHSLFELLVHGQDGGVAHEGEGQDGNGVDGLGGGTNRSNGTLKGNSSLSPSSGRTEIFT